MDTQENLMKKLMDKAGEDSSFRESLIDNPSSALKEAFDIDVPDGFNVVVHEDDARTAHLVLPASAELTDVQLQHVAGGRCTGGWAGWASNL